MKISVVTVCYNSEATIEGTVRSFLAQQYPDKEMVVVDGQSRDRTLEIARSFDAGDIRIISEKDRGIYDAMNKGLRLFRGDAVGFLNSDDTFHNDQVLDKIADALARAEAVHSGVVIVKDHRTKAPVRRWKGKPLRRGAFRHGWMPPHPTFYVRRALAKRARSFDLRYRPDAAYNFMLRALKPHTNTVEYILGPLVDFLSRHATRSSVSVAMESILRCLDSREEHLGSRFYRTPHYLGSRRATSQQSWHTSGSVST